MTTRPSELPEELGLPTFTAGNLRLFKRLAIVTESGVIAKAFYPVFPPDTHPVEVLAWVLAHFNYPGVQTRT